ncbi:transglycosylase SLT domain-containing protein [Paraburkholderia sp.]|uniref:lytic transglycosylase domain-containing protein n=1 Tax=Paraburkholderia sp. TaxID=1926495 RepID=UPI002385BFBE|nr:transglycosylase SLT domain-containing protein [Paraburkholderia sp.]MDE1181164.1 transglycosylase SLT domain-containing protein [Paraburkholderia sp.]
MSRLPSLIVLSSLSLSLAHPARADDGHTDTDRSKMSAYLTQKFGVAKEKAEEIANAVQASATKYSLPPALLLAIISIESRFKEKAKGANGATGLMQVVPGAHRRMLKNVKDLTDPGANIEIGSAILYGYKQSAGGDLNAALKNYGGSQAYAQKVSLRADTFEEAVGSNDDAASPAFGFCAFRWLDRCPTSTVHWSALTAPVGNTVALLSVSGMVGALPVASFSPPFTP